MFRTLAPYVPPVLTTAILGTLALQEFDHLAPEPLRSKLKPLLARKREPPVDFEGDAAPQVGVFAGNDRAYSAVLLVQGSSYSDKRLLARSAAKACSHWYSKDVDLTLGFSPRIWETVKSHVPLGTVVNTDFKLKERRGEQTGKVLPATGGDLMIHVKADSNGKCVEVLRSVLKELDPKSLSWSEDIYGYTEEHPAASTCPTTNSWMSGAASLCKIACVPKIGSSYALVQRWEDDDISSKKFKAKPISNHRDRMNGMDQDGNKLSLVKYVMRTGKLGSKSEGDKPGLLFVAYSSDPKVFDYMLDRMVGRRGKVEDTTMQEAKCTRGQQFYIPSQAQINALVYAH